MSENIRDQLTASVPKPTLQLIELPNAPKNTSPVPELTSIHSVRRRGPYGNGRYRGNCGGYLIRNLLRYFQPKRVLDPMSGSGTCRDVCRELKIKCDSFDIRRGQDANHPGTSFYLLCLISSLS